MLRSARVIISVPSPLLSQCPRSPRLLTISGYRLQKNCFNVLSHNEKGSEGDFVRPSRQWLSWKNYLVCSLGIPLPQPCVGVPLGQELCEEGDFLTRATPALDRNLSLGRLSEEGRDGGGGANGPAGGLALCSPPK